MAITIGSSNISSLQAQRSLSDATSKVDTAFQRLASGLRINQASDDAAGLSVSSALTANSRVYARGIQNLNDGISALSIAQSALTELSSITQRQLELATEASNGTYSFAQRSALNNESNALSDEYNRLLGTSTFNGFSIFNSNANSLLLQSGYGANGTINASVGQQLAQTGGNGTFATGVSIQAGGQSALVDTNGDGIADNVSLVNGAVGATKTLVLHVSLGNGDGTFAAASSTQLKSYGSGVNAQHIVVNLTAGDFNNDGTNDLLVEANYVGFSGISSVVSAFLGNGNGTFKADSLNQSVNVPGGLFSADHNDTVNLGIQIGDFNGDGKLDVIEVASNQYDPYNESFATAGILYGNGDGSFAAKKTVASFFGTSSANLNFVVADFNHDGVSDFLFNSTIYNSQGNGSFNAGQSFALGTGAIVAGDFNNDGNVDFANVLNSTALNIFYGSGGGSFGAATSIATAGSITNLAAGDVNGDGIIDLVGESSGKLQTFLSSVHDGFQNALVTNFAPTTTATSLSIVDVNNDGVADIFSSAGAQTFRGNATRSESPTYVNLTSAASARQAISTLTAQLSRITLELGHLGSNQSVINTEIAAATAKRDNFAAASSRITDVDVAEESSTLVRTEILQQAAASVLAQANQQPALALKLFK